MDIGDRIRAAREHAGLTQRQLAEAVGVTESAVTLWENRKNRRGVTNEHLDKVAEVLNVSIGFLLGEPEKRRLAISSGNSTIVVSKAERTLLDLFRSFSQELQLLQLAQFVECAKLGKVEQLPGHDRSHGVGITHPGNRQPA